MTQKQHRATGSLKKALNRCAAAGLRGGVYDASFCIWPIDGPDPRENNFSEVRAGGQFFNLVSEHGVILDGVKMMLDGGAGV